MANGVVLGNTVLMRSVASVTPITLTSPSLRLSQCNCPTPRQTLSHRCPFPCTPGHVAKVHVIPQRGARFMRSAVQVYQLSHKKRNTYHTKASVYWDPEVDVVFMGVRGVQASQLSPFVVTPITLVCTSCHHQSVTPNKLPFYTSALLNVAQGYAIPLCRSFSPQLAFAVTARLSKCGAFFRITTGSARVRPN